MKRHYDHGMRVMKLKVLGEVSGWGCRREEIIMGFDCHCYVDRIICCLASSKCSDKMAEKLGLWRWKWQTMWKIYANSSCDWDASNSMTKNGIGKVFPCFCHQTRNLYQFDWFTLVLNANWHPVFKPLCVAHDDAVWTVDDSLRMMKVFRCKIEITK